MKRSYSIIWWLYYTCVWSETQTNERSRNQIASEIRAIPGRVIKIPPAKERLKRMPILLAKVQAGNTSENLLNEIKQIIHLLYWPKQMSKKFYNKLVKQYKDQHNIHALRK